MTIPVDNSDRQMEAYAFLRGALSRCDQEGCKFTDVIQVIKSWADTKNIAKPKTFRYIRLTEKSPLPEIGTKVRIEEGAMCPHEIGDIGIVVNIGGSHRNYIGVKCENHKSGNVPKFDWEYYLASEVSLVIEE